MEFAMHKLSLLCIGTSLLLLSACQDAPTTEPVVGDNFIGTYQGINDADLRVDIQTLASDEFEGRAPTGKGEERTLNYLVERLQSLGLQPGNGDSYLQAVELLEITAEPNMVLQLGEASLTYKQDMVVSSKHEKTKVSLSDSPLVFVGYGINAPEYAWNDYQGLDVKGKTVVILVNDPGFEDPTSGKFQGRSMTYYGRWTYKYEEASRQGAAGAIIVHETAPASYGWSVVANSWGGAQYGLVSSNGNADRVAVEGWISFEAAEQLFKAAELIFAEQKALAIAGPYNQDLKQTASVVINNTLKKSTSYNVMATLPGREHPEEHIIYSAHWDHLGMDASKDGDQIYNGAHDNATGIAANLSMAKAFSQLSVAPLRSVSFLFVTAEEQGLLGSLYYAAHPLVPLAQTVANINMDAMNVLGRTKDVAVVGMGKSELENYLAKAALRQQRHVVEESNPERGSYFRSDHFSFAQQGVPALYAKGGSEAIDEETAQYRKRTNVIITGCYHQLCDHYRENWDLSGMVQDVQLLFEVGHAVANSSDWPQWSPNAEFQRKKS